MKESQEYALQFFLSNCFPISFFKIEGYIKVKRFANRFFCQMFSQIFHDFDLSKRDQKVKPSGH